MARQGRILIGCSGWQYKHWRGNFYPLDLPQKQWLEFYARRFDSVEINNSFYRLPEAGTFADWRARTPRDFVFAVKASRYLTHMKKLKDPGEGLERFFSHARSLGRKLAVVLYQLPPHWGCNVERLAAFLDVAPRDVRQAVEFREPSWYCDDVRRALESRRASLCLHDMAGSATEREQVGPFVYVRFHGPGQRYQGGYSREHLRGWAVWLRERASGGSDVFAYFNNDVGGHAPRDAETLRNLVA